ncbi:hypothetical protein LTR09_006998 [Extremus antarcticus]|uniref:Peptidase A1 domain-containing protein n=1 Tax=Extremus antarcticus TaxID=702011 RepID=A0AAJ0DDL4_9PEZI|nr:hypothetical protein LTR09_006998 [Extremus antarcticus]
MHRGLALLVTITAGLINAAPTPSKPQPKRHFKVPVKGHKKLSPAHAMSHACRKYGGDVTFFDPEKALDTLFPDADFGYQASSADWYAYPSSSSAAPMVYYTASAAPWDITPQSSSAALVPFESSSLPAAPSGYGVSGSPFSASAAPSSKSAIVSSVSASSSMPVASSSSPVSSGVESSSAPVPSNSPSSSSATASAPAPSASSPSGDGAVEGEVTATPEANEAAYYSSVDIGGQKLNLNFDTGSADMWVYNTGMSSGLTSGHAVYNPVQSSTFTKYNGGTWEIQYGDGSTAKGTVGFDTVTIGGVVAQKQCIELAEQVTGTFLEDSDTDGLLGLAFSVINTVLPQPQKTFFENVMDELEQPLFTADLEEDASGTYEFGSIDERKYSGEIHYAPVDNGLGFWQVESNTYTIGGARKTCTVCSPTIIDTGTSLVLMDDDVVKAYYQQVSGARYDSQNYGYMYPCIATLPDFGIAIGDYTAVINGSDITYAEASASYCFGGIQGNQGTGVQILGDVLLKQFFAVFDGGNMQFGIADKA